MPCLVGGSEIFDRGAGSFEAVLPFFALEMAQRCFNL